MNKKVFIIILVVVVLSLGGWFVSSTTNQSSKRGTEFLTHEEAREISDEVVIMKDTDYDKDEVKIKVGQTVGWINDGNSPMWPASNLHPTHEIYSDFDPREPVNPGEAWTFTFKEKGNWRFHDHLKPNIVGVIIVE